MRTNPDPVLPKGDPNVEPELGILHKERLEGIIGQAQDPAVLPVLLPW